MSRRNILSEGHQSWLEPARTEAVRRALDAARDHTATEDLLFLEAWETHTLPDVSAALRAYQIRRANPVLAAELRAELKHGRPLTPQERGVLAAMHG